MHAGSKAQRKAASDALAAKRGEIDKNELRGPSLEMFESMSEEELQFLAKCRARRDEVRHD